MEEEISSTAEEEVSKSLEGEENSNKPKEEAKPTEPKQKIKPVTPSEEDEGDFPLFVRDIPPVLHILVVGFHHKKGCQIEYSYPPLDPESVANPHECPELWKNLPSLAMPDGSHNFVEDTVYFHLPSLTHEGKTVYGVSTYRQIEAKMLSKKTADITRSTVQKSVCVLSNLPLYGHIQVKMGLITQAYFREGDFTQHSLLQDAYKNLNMCLNPELLHSTQAIIGLPLRDLIEKFGLKVVQLFKLVLLEKRVLFFHSPVRPLCSSILAVLALFPGLVESGLDTCTSYENQDSNDGSEIPTQMDEPLLIPDKQSGNANRNVSGSDITDETRTTTSTRQSSFEDLRAPTLQEMENEEKAGRLSPTLVAGLPNEDCGLPIHIFGDGYLCHPYLSLSYMEVLNDPNIRGYVIGATNVLFKQKKSLFDAVIELETGRIDIFDEDLRRQLELTKEDLRFADHIIRNVIQDRTNTFLDGVGWEGGDDWLRAEFKSYLLFMLRTSLLDEPNRYLDEFNSSFMQAWKTTKNYKKWNESSHPAVMELLPGHLFSGQLSMSDVKLKFSQISTTVQNSEKAKKLTIAAANTSRAVAATGKVVGGAITQAKGVFSQWWSTFQTAEQDEGAAAASANRTPTSDN